MISLSYHYFCLRAFLFRNYLFPALHPFNFEQIIQKIPPSKITIYQNTSNLKINSCEFAFKNKRGHGEHGFYALRSSFLFFDREIHVLGIDGKIEKLENWGRISDEN